MTKDMPDKLKQVAFEALKIINSTESILQISDVYVSKNSRSSKQSKQITTKQNVQNEANNLNK